MPRTCSLLSLTASVTRTASSRFHRSGVWKNGHDANSQAFSQDIGEIGRPLAINVDSNLLTDSNTALSHARLLHHRPFGKASADYAKNNLMAL
jgi:hypothetical protein